MVGFSGILAGFFSMISCFLGMLKIYFYGGFYLTFANVSTALPRIFHHKILNTQIPFSFAGYTGRKPIVGGI